MSNTVRGLPGAILGTLQRCAAVGAAALPKRWWPSLDPYVPVSDSALLGAIATILAAAAIAVPGFIAHTSDQVARNNQAILDAAAVEAGRKEGSDTDPRAWGRAITGASSLSLFTFILLTPAGWISTYLGLSGTWRAAAAAVDDPFGDPILTGLDALVVRGARRSRAARTRNERESLEGPDAPDRLVRGSYVGLPNADVAIVCARRKPEWDIGTVVDTGDAWFRVASIDERTVGGWLRTVYALSEHRDHEVFRRRVRYTLPPQAGGGSLGDPGA